MKYALLLLFVPTLIFCMDFNDHRPANKREKKAGKTINTAKNIVKITISSENNGISISDTRIISTKTLNNANDVFISTKNLTITNRQNITNSRQN